MFCNGYHPLYRAPKIESADQSKENDPSKQNKTPGQICPPSAHPDREDAYLTDPANNPNYHKQNPARTYLKRNKTTQNKQPSAPFETILQEQSSSGGYIYVWL